MIDVTKPHLKNIIHKSIEPGVAGKMGEPIIRRRNTLVEAIERSIEKSQERSEKRRE